MRMHACSSVILNTILHLLITIRFFFLFSSAHCSLKQKMDLVTIVATIAVIVVTFALYKTFFANSNTNTNTKKPNTPANTNNNKKTNTTNAAAGKHRKQNT